MKCHGVKEKSLGLFDAVLFQDPRPVVTDVEAHQKFRSRMRIKRNKIVPVEIGIFMMQ